MRPIVRLKDEEVCDMEKINALKNRAIDELSEYLYCFTPTEKGLTKSSIMGPVGKLLDAVTSGKVESPDGLTGYVISIHKNLSQDEQPPGREAMMHLEEGVKNLVELRRTAPKRLWLKLKSDMDYAIYKRKMKRIFELADKKKDEKSAAGNEGQNQQ
ncbi:MAG: hypothetical protein QW728_06235 [Thermoplasmata archaeon]